MTLVSSPTTSSCESWKLRKPAVQQCPPKPEKKEDIKGFRSDLRDHIKPQLICDRYGFPTGLHYYPRFILQLALYSHNGSTCRFDYCTHRIKPGQYRIALTPGMSDSRGPGETIYPNTNTYT